MIEADQIPLVPSLKAFIAAKNGDFETVKAIIMNTKNSAENSTFLHPVPRKALYDLIRTQCNIELELQFDDDIEGQLAMVDKLYTEDISQSESHESETYVEELKIKRALQYIDYGDLSKGLSLLQAVKPRASLSRLRTELDFCILRCAWLLRDSDLYRSTLKGMRELVNLIDYEQRQRLKVYCALIDINFHDFEEGARTFISYIPSFTKFELFEFKHLIFYAAVFGGIKLNRADLKKAVRENPDWSVQAAEFKPAITYLENLLNGQYSQAFQALLELGDMLKRDYYFGDLTEAVLKLGRVKLYRQYTNLFSKVKLSQMAVDFGLPASLMEHDLVRIVSDDFLAVKINKETGYIECQSGLGESNVDFKCLDQKIETKISMLQRLLHSVVG